MYHRLTVALLAACAASPFVFAGAANAAGFYVQEESVRGLSRAYSGEASDSGADSLWWNPAAIGGDTQSELYSGLQIIDLSVKANDAGSTITRPFQATSGVGGNPSQSNPVETGYVPSLDGAWRINDQWSLGLGINAPFDFTTKYSPNSWARYGALTSRLTDIDVQPTVAWSPSKMLSVGVGLDAQYLSADLTNALPNLSPLLPDGASSLHGDGWNYGWDIGAQVRPDDHLTVGFSYRSQIDHELTGKVAVAGLLGPLAANNFTVPASAKFNTPSMITLGARWRLNDRWTLDGQIQHFGWSAFKAINITYIGQTAPTPENYKDTTTEAVGAEYAWSPALTLRAGVQFDPTPTNNDGRSARVPDGDRVLIGFGGGYKASRHLTLDLSAAYIEFASSHVNNNATAFAGTPVVTPVSLQGDITASGLIVSAGAKFGF
jgi:long-chain fatty acid transport protein